MMTQQSHHFQESELVPNQNIRELLDVLLTQEATYPWNPTDPETESYLLQLEDNFRVLDAFDEQIVASRADQFFNHIEHYWTEVASVTPMCQSLIEKFGEFVPTTWLERIAQQVEKTLNINLELNPLEQLVSCVQPVLVDWTEADLQVFARPFASAMRSGNPETTTNRLQQTNWEQLSPVEQARFSVAIAHYALQSLKSENNR